MFSVCVGVMGEVWFSFFLMYLFHASVLFFSMYYTKKNRDLHNIQHTYIHEVYVCVLLGVWCEGETDLVTDTLPSSWSLGLQKEVQ